MSTITCKNCGKKLTAKMKKCPYCAGAEKSSKLNLVILIFAVSAAASIITIITDSNADQSKSSTIKAKTTAEKEPDNNTKGVSFSQVVGSLLKSSSISKNSQQASELSDTEDLAQVESYEEPNEDFAGDATFSEPDEVDSFEEEATETASSAVKESSEKEIRRKYWQKYYQKKFSLPNAGTKVSVQLKNGSAKSGKFMGVVNHFVKLMVNEKLESINKAKLSKRSQLRYFYSDYVNYCTNKKLTEEGLN